MSNQGFEHLDRDALDLQLSAIFRHWEATILERAEFIGWAWVVAGAADHSASEDRAQAVTQLREERDAIHSSLAETLMRTSLVNLRLISQRMFLDWLAERLDASRAAA
jgi:hypothetical protein